MRKPPMADRREEVKIKRSKFASKKVEKNTFGARLDADEVSQEVENARLLDKSYGNREHLFNHAVGSDDHEEQKESGLSPWM